MPHFIDAKNARPGWFFQLNALSAGEGLARMTRQEYFHRFSFHCVLPASSCFHLRLVGDLAYHLDAIDPLVSIEGRI